MDSGSPPFAVAYGGIYFFLRLGFLPAIGGGTECMERKMHHIIVVFLVNFGW
jgi:hypothetical protein